MRPNVHYTLERFPSIKRALQYQDVIFLDIYKFEHKFGCFQGPEKLNEKFLNFIYENKITSIFTSSEWLQFISVDTILYLTSNNVIVASVLGDDENNYHININYLGLFTVPVAYQNNEYKKYLFVNPKTARMPISVSMNDSESYLHLPEKNDVIFIGKAYGNRPKILQYLHKNGIRLTIYGGNQWKKYFDRSVYKGYIDNSNYYTEIAKSKIVLALLESPNNAKLLHVNAKPFDAAKTGTALISTRFNNFFKDYKLQEGVDLLAYSSKEELLLVVKKLLDDDDLRDSMSASFRNKIKKKYNYDVLYKSLFSKIFSIKETKPKINQARILFIENFTNPDPEVIKGYDYLIFKKKGVVYSKAINNILSAHIASNKFIKLDSFYNGKVARKIFNFVDVASLAIPVKMLHTLPRLKGIVRISKERSAQTFICLNHYQYFSLYISVLIIIRSIYKRFS
jgi:spore maturation protein CgeB